MEKANETTELVEKLNLEINSLKQKLEKAKAVEAKLVEAENFIDHLKGEVDTARKAESDALSLVEDWHKEIEEIRNQQSMDMAVLLSTTQELERAKQGLFMTSNANNQELSQAPEIAKFHAKLAMLESKVEVKDKLINKIKVLKDEDEKNKRVVERLTSVLYDVSSDSREAKKKLLSIQAEFKNAETQLEDMKLKLSLNERNGKHVIISKKLLEEEWKISNPSNPIVFLDISIGGTPPRRIIIELFSDVTPRTAENFRALCTGEKGIGVMGMPLHYKGSIFHQISPGEFCQGGNIPAADREGGESIYGGKFPTENFIKKHTGIGVVAMAWPKTNGSEFYICHSKLEIYDGQYCVFGQVMKGFDVLGAIDMVGSQSWRPTKEVKIVDCGQLC